MSSDLILPAPVLAFMQEVYCRAVEEKPLTKATDCCQVGDVSILIRLEG